MAINKALPSEYMNYEINMLEYDFEIIREKIMKHYNECKTDQLFYKIIDQDIYEVKPR